mmetsp:Transcript_16663/g.27817  ORF Transcript_16663/g.27817 Transcript_16663/m.27817 type:complete len:475 (-) Transcript_16663:340-1764(-)|eukprot:CAMPEP_0114431040 /NCGR_PEP_ID=MMETSP0103-20121206/10378_1 /TAXON_ID=37642 ORGANISM="Paraphysomonas imperforata, Strain PA2" /NCGR_SAMPLE_ID=MMETSP0103 /ASSEMBLY_ACC=CAM_ASM_000201 /LENGTH=474 /DNA_ID=CAMNT_0001600559 /DNA_START=270 /DNA_END=1694 /DNA_ORIENTATION=-
MSSPRHKSTDDSLKEGWLEKKGSFVRSWKRRYFVLTSSALNYYTDETLSELKGSVPIVSTSRVMHRDGSSHQFKFGLCTGKRLLEIACTSDEHRTRWKKCIQELINRLQMEGMKAGGTCSTERTTVFDDLISINRLDRTNMVEDTPMNRARKQQQEKLAQQQGQKQPPSAGTDTKLMKDTKEDALWGGADSDVSESDSEGEGEETQTSKTGGRGSKVKKGARRRLNGSKSKKGSGERGSSISGSDCSVANDLQHHKQQAQTPSTGGNDKNVGTVEPDVKGLKLGGDAQDGWEEFVSDKGEQYYYHRESKITRWEKPTPEVTRCIQRRLEEERLQSERANEKRKLELKHNKIVEEELQDYTNQIQATVTQQIQLWKHPVGKKRARVLGELLNAVPALLGPELIPLDSSLVTTPLLKTDPPTMVKKAYRKVVRFVHPDKVAGTGCVIDVEKKMLAAEVFIAINESFEKFRAQHEEL